jgi:hypothetical protein
VTEASIHTSFGRFRERRAVLTSASGIAGKAARLSMDSELALAVGVLIGGGFPGCAAAVSVAAEHLFPEVEFAWKADADGHPGS